jgi:ribosome-associated protein
VGRTKTKRLIDSEVGPLVAHGRAQPDSRPVLAERDSEEDVRHALDIAMGKKALVPVLLDVRGLTSYTDFIGIVSGTSDRQVETIADAVVADMKRAGRRPLGVEEGPQRRWSLVDFGDFVIHVFHHQTREFYDLESMLADAPRMQLDVPPELRYVAECY